MVGEVKNLQGRVHSRRSQTKSSAGVHDDFQSSLLQLEDLRSGLEDAYRVSLPLPIFESLPDLKRFCTDALGPSGRNHDWFRACSKVKLRYRLAVLGSLFLFRKVLPSEDPSVDDYIANITTPAPPPPPGFLEFVDASVDMMFRPGWDQPYYGSRVKGATLPISSCLERSRKKGGCRHFATASAREAFCKGVLSKIAPVPNVRRARLSLAECDGKNRLVTVNSYEMQRLIPYHESIYNHLSKKDWLLRGEATANRFREFTKKRGEVFVSGDFKSATDNVNLDVARTILRRINSNCSKVPEGIREGALDTLGGILDVGVEYQIQRGQLMGNALSFPLLCLQNYLSFKWFVRRRVPVKINGDDIVFRATPKEADSWAKGVKSCGLELSVGKTMVERDHFSLNSTYFTSGREKVRLVPVVRSTQWFKCVSSMEAIPGRINSFVAGASRRVRDAFVGRLLRSMTKSIWASNRSLRRDLGCNVTWTAISKAGLARRETFYLQTPPPPPLKAVVKGYWKFKVPDGWHQGPKKVDETPFYEALVEEAWKPVRNQETDAWRTDKDGTFTYCEITKRFKYRLPKEYGFDLSSFYRLFKRKKYWYKCEGCDRCSTEKGEVRETIPEEKGWQLVMRRITRAGIPPPPELVVGSGRSGLAIVSSFASALRGGSV